MKKLSWRNRRNNSSNSSYLSAVLVERRLFGRMREKARMKSNAHATIHTSYYSFPFFVYSSIYTDCIAVCCYCWCICSGTNRGKGMYTCKDWKETPCHLFLCLFSFSSFSLCFCISIIPYGVTVVGSDELCQREIGKMISDHYSTNHDTLRFPLVYLFLQLFLLLHLISLCCQSTLYLLLGLTSFMTYLYEYQSRSFNYTRTTHTMMEMTAQLPPLLTPRGDPNSSSPSMNIKRIIVNKRKSNIC